MMQATPRSKFVPHKVLKEGWTYFTVSDSDYVIGVKSSVTKVMRVEGPDGSPAIGPDGAPAYVFNTTNVVKILTSAEWKILKQQDSLE